MLIHGWPLSCEMWEYQLGDLVEAGFRWLNTTAGDLVNRRNHGMVTIDDSLALSILMRALMEELDLRDATLCWFFNGRW